MNSMKAMYGCGLNFFIKLAYNSLFYISLQMQKYFSLLVAVLSFGRTPNLERNSSTAYKQPTFTKGKIVLKCVKNRAILRAEYVYL